MKWDAHSSVIIASFCLEVAKSRFNGTADEGIAYKDAWNLYTQVDVEYCDFDNFVLFAYNGQEVLKVSSSRVTRNMEIRLSEEEADKAITMIALIDQLQVEPTYCDLRG